MNVIVELEALRFRIAESNEPDTLSDDVNRLSIVPIDGGIDLHYYGVSWDEVFDDLLTTLAQPAIAREIRSLHLGGPDMGANGTRNWNLEPLLAQGATFERLLTLDVRQTQPADHNRSILGADFSEEGVLGRFLDRAPVLRQLRAPSAPAANFFELPRRPLEFLSVDAGYDTQNFIRNFANSACFENLTLLEWGEYNETYIDDYRTQCTSFADYEALFRSSAFATVRRFVWRNSANSPEEIQALKAIRPGVQTLLVRATAEYW